MLKTIVLPERLTLEWIRINNGKMNGFDIDSGEKIAKKSEKSKRQNLFKSGNLKDKKLSKP